jgi:hypothetical protein
MEVGAHMSPAPRLWDTVAATWRAGDLHECVRITRAAVDAEPYDMAPRHLLAALYLALRQPGMALLQYERLLPLAVGRGELFLALAAQRRLDELHAGTSLHERRYHAMHQWFVSLARKARQRGGDDEARVFGPHVLVGLPPADFARAAEHCRVETLGIDARVVTPETGLLWVVLHGRVRWAVSRDGQPASRPTVAEPGDLIVLAGPGAAGVQVTVEPETPAECLCLDPELFAALGTEAAADEAVREVTDTPAVEEWLADLQALASSPLDIDAIVADLPSFERVRHPSLPVPDPLAEPQLAVGAPMERRRETRLSVHTESRVAMLGLAGTRVAPLPGALADLDPEGLAVRFRRGDALQAAARLRGSVIAVHLALPGDEQIVHLAARVDVADGDAGASDPDTVITLRLGFLEMLPSMRARIADAAHPGTAAAA